MHMNTLIILCFLFTVTHKATSNSQLLPADHISINCGSTASSTSLRGREWIGDFYPKSAVQGSSTTSTVDSSVVDRVPYNTARISRSRFSYTFHLNPGQKIIRLHFNPASYKGFRRFHDFFTVEAGRFTLLANFSASIAAVNSFSKEFCVIIRENHPFNIVFTPSISSSKYTYAFINGIEIISVPSSVNYCNYWHGEITGVQVVGYIDNSTALELVHRQNIKWGSVSSSDDISSMFGMWEATKKLKGNRDSSIRWRISVDVGFRYLVRIHFKLSNHDYSLASPNPLPSKTDSPLQPIQILLSLLGRRNALATVVFAVICLVNIIVYMLQQVQGANITEEEENKPSPRAKRLCRRFSLAEIQLATDNFFDAFVIGKGGFGKVYKGIIDNGRETVAIKRLKPDSKQGKREFWAEVETLSELRHVNLVSLIGYCNEQPEMILVYEYMPCGTLADHLYKLARKNNVYHPLYWKQRLQICIGAGRGLDYLHRGLENEIIHRDMKASNILLDENFVAKVSDFGLAKIKSGSKSQKEASTNLKGTFGYIDPDYFRSHRLTIGSDTYSFGVVLLEVLCGRPAVEPWVEEDKRSLTMWARDNIAKGEVDHIVDPSLREEISPDSLKTFLRIAEKCLLDEPKKRPAIAHVVMILEFALEQQDHTQSLVLNERARIADIFPSTDLANPRPAGQILPQPKLRVFTFKELKTATRNFRSDALLGEGDFGKVYKGWLDEKTHGKPGSRTVIAVKKLYPESMQGFEEWQSEVNFLGRLSHRNLVRLLGYCWGDKDKDKELLLVYEFMQKGSLENHLFRRGSSVQPLPWNIRLKILIGAAHGLAFLHASDGKVIHRDFKTSNILLDESYHAKISDFGLARMGPTAGKSHVSSTRVMGTCGYAAPEYVATGHLYVKSDVYAFGVVLVEMLTGLRAIDTNCPGKQHFLADWIKPHLSERRKLKHIIDSRLEGKFSSRSAFDIAQLALNCLQSEPKMRPSMQEAVEILEKMDVAIENPRVHFT